MTPVKDDTQEIDFCQEFQIMLHEKVRLAVRYTLITVLEEEVDAFIGAGRYERSDQRRDLRNGTYPRSLGTSVGQIKDLPVPRTRKGFRTQVFDRVYVRVNVIADLEDQTFDTRELDLVQGLPPLQGLDESSRLLLRWVLGCSLFDRDDLEGDAVDVDVLLDAEIVIVAAAQAARPATTKSTDSTHGKRKRILARLAIASPPLSDTATRDNNYP